MNLEEKDKAYIWHPFTQMKTAKRHIVIKSAKGAMLYDEEGKSYIDAISSWWVNVHGHSHPYIAERIHEQLTTLAHVIFAGFSHEPAIELSERLLAYLPHQQKVFFSDNGSTATEIGMKMCIQYFYNQGIEKDTILALDNAYHGDTFGAMAAGADDGFNNPFKSWLFDVQRIPTPVPGEEEMVLEQLRKVLKEHKVACFIFEPIVQGSAGMLMYTPEVLDKMIAICRENGVLCIADEVMTGFYRTGKMFASDYLKNKPDITCLSKGLTGGTLPLSLTLCTQEIYDIFLSDDMAKTFFHGHSFTGNPIGCAAALASLDLFEQQETQDNVNRIVSKQSLFKEKIKNHSAVRKIRQQGTILAMEVETGTYTSYFSSIRNRLYDFFMERGVLLRPLGNVIYVLPPYCISDEELERVYEVIEEALEFFNN